MQTVERIEKIVMLPKDLLERASQMTSDAEISMIIEMALRDFVAGDQGRELNRREIELINSNSDELNAEAMDTLEYQQVNW
jgi:hypothetical protein